MEFNRILVPVAGTRADEEAVRLACRLARKRKGKVYALYVITVNRALPLDARIEAEIETAEGILSRVEDAASDEDYEVETDLLQARNAGPAIVDEAVAREADLIVMGLPYKMPFGQFSIGEVAPYLLKNAPCRVLLLRELPG
jgi:nucleotide-binding universal stress UspA family protein